MDQLDHFQLFTADSMIGRLDRIDNRGADLPGEAGELELFMIAGRRQAKRRGDILTGWDDRTRA